MTLTLSTNLDKDPNTAGGEEILVNCGWTDG